MWWQLFWKVMKNVFFIQIVGGIVLGFIVIVIMVLDFNIVDVCFDMQFLNWMVVFKGIQVIIVIVVIFEVYVV